MVKPAAPQKRGFFRRRRSEETESRALTELDVPWMHTPTAAGVAITPDSALRIVDVLACVRLLAESASVCPLIPYRRTGESRQRSTGALRDLLARPAPATSQANLIASTVGALALRGNAYWGKFRDPSGRLAQLAAIPPDRVSVALAGPGAEPVYTLLSDQGVSQHGPEDILHFKGVSFDGVYGVSPIQMAREALGLAAALTETAAALFGNQTIPRGVLTVPAGNSEDDQMEALRAGFRDRHGGSANAGRVAILTSDINFTPVSLSPADAELLAARKLSSTEIARLFRVPPYLIAAESGSSMTYSNVESEGLNFLRFSLAPWLTVIEQGVTGDPDLCLPGEFVEFLADAFLRADSLARAQAYEIGLRAGYLTADEVRQRENLPPLPPKVSTTDA